MSRGQGQDLFIKLPKWRWRSHVGAKAGPWTMDELYIHLMFLADERIFSGAPFPSRRRLVAQTGLSEAKVRGALRHYRRWVPADRLPLWEQLMIEDGRIRPGLPGAAPPGPEEEKRQAEEKLRYVRPARARTRTSGDEDTLQAEVARRLRRRHYAAISDRDPAAMLDVVRRVLSAVLERAPTSIEVSNARWCVLGGLTRAVEAGLDVEAYVADVELVAKAARLSPQWEFRYVRGYVGDVRKYRDQSRDIRFLLWKDAWDARVKAARAWTAPPAPGGEPDAPAGGAKPMPADVRRAWASARARLEEGDQDATWSADLPLDADPAEDVRRRTALASVVLVLGGRPTVRELVEDDRVEQMFAAFYEHGDGDGGPGPPDQPG